MSAPSPKVFVLDTSVILYDGNAAKSFQEHDVAVPLTVLEELDGFKKGNSVINLHAREFLRQLDGLSQRNDLRHWIPINGPGHGRFRVVGEDGIDDATRVFGSPKNDHRILNAALRLAKVEDPRQVILVSKDINLRVKARALELRAEDYETVRIRDIDRLYTGKAELEVDPRVIDRLHESGSLPAEDALGDVLADGPLAHQYFILRGNGKSALAHYAPETRLLERLTKAASYGIKPRNAEQTFALHAITDPRVSLVSICGAAGTGKTLLALAGSLEERRSFRQVFLARPIVPLSNKDIGYLPGDVDSKISPYMQPIWDNLAVIKGQYAENGREHARIDEMVQLGKLQILPLTYIRGRSFSKIMFIVDEAQNLTPHEVKTIITRAGEGTKIVLTGDIFQIDSPYLDAQSNGLSYLVDRMKGQELYAHVTLEKGERSELANLASNLL